MILDKGLVLCSAKTLSISGAASDMSTVLDLAAGSATAYIDGTTTTPVYNALKGDADLELFLVVTCTTACTGSGNLNLQLRTRASTITSGTGTVLWETGDVAKSAFTVGKQYQLRVPRGLLRYVALEFKADASESVGTFDAQLVKDIDANDM